MRTLDELLAKYDVPGPRYTSYPTVPEWNESFGAAGHARALAQAGSALSLYVHIPFCREMCTYCGCNVVVSKDPRRADRYLDALAHELDLVAAQLGERRVLSRLHLGGGTPTFLDEEQLRRLWRHISSSFDVAGDAELAVEIDPAVTSVGQLELLRSFGWNRLSMGVQDLEPSVQQAINRIQTVEETAAAIATARRLGFRSVNLDMIYGLPRQTEASWTRTMDQIVTFAPDRISLFSFAYVPASRPHQKKLAVFGFPTGREKMELFELARDRLMAAGYRDIGLDHFALESDELAIARREGRLWRDFQGYTVGRYDTIGTGVTGISSVGGAYVQNLRSLIAHESAVSRGELPTARGMWLSDDDRARREVITSLMCNLTAELPDGIDADLTELVADRIVTVDAIGRRVTVTDVGRRFLRNVAMKFDAYLGKKDRAFSRTV
jgi:oxygen-independent coproporphyrinogen-3 oxidase